MKAKKEKLSAPIEVNNISKSFKEKKVLDNVSLSLKEGEIFGLVGLNGAGKTTLMKIILNLLKQNSGEAKFFGDKSGLRRSRKNIAFLPEKFHPSPYLKGVEFFRFVFAVL